MNYRLEANKDALESLRMPTYIVEDADAYVNRMERAAERAYNDQREW